jgi:hypothetical protein
MVTQRERETDYIIADPVSGRTYTLELDREALLLAAMRELVTFRDNERDRAQKSKAARRTTARSKELYGGHGGVGGIGATVRDRNHARARFSDAERQEVLAQMRAGITPRSFEEIFERRCRSFQLKDELTPEGGLTEMGRRKLAMASFDAERVYKASVAGCGGLTLSSVTDDWLLLWRSCLRDAELGCVLDAAGRLGDEHCDDGFRRAFSRALAPRMTAGQREDVAQVQRRHARTADKRWNEIRRRAPDCGDPRSVPVPSLGVRVVRERRA